MRTSVIADSSATPRREVRGNPAGSGKAIYMPMRDA
jgi:hypothetical protein